MKPDLRLLSETISVGPQITPADLEGLAAAGIRRVVNNRPDGEEPGQPGSDQMADAARAAGLDYVYAPVSGMPGPEAVSAVAKCLADDVPTVMYCRSGMRSAATWAMAMRSLGRADAETLHRAGASAGYDLSRIPL